MPEVEPPRVLPESVDRRLYRMIHSLPHSTVGDRYVTTLSDLGEGLGWVAAGIAVAESPADLGVSVQRAMKG